MVLKRIERTSSSDDRSDLAGQFKRTSTTLLDQSGAGLNEGHPTSLPMETGGGDRVSADMTEDQVYSLSAQFEASHLQNDDQPALPPLPPKPAMGQQEDRTTGTAPSEDSLPPPPAVLPPQVNETYQIKHIIWKGVSSSGEFCKVPVLVQNANGPCPLLAIVNALSLSVPVNCQSGLWRILRGREHVSLRLLLEGVVDELIRRRGGDVAQGLPDVGALYAFLTTLHTGMTVNPRFVPAMHAFPNLMDAPVDSDGSLIMAEDHDSDPGFFEQTEEMHLYGTFSIPLVHGWLPSQIHPAYMALQRSASTHEDAGLLLCKEDELEAKLSVEGLNHDEQQLLQDLVIVKYFLGQTATQLTTHGLNALKRAMAPGAIFILFRNDHFSTIYKHPQTNQLLQLVTDMGYAAHEGVVWESLVDTTGEGSEFLDGGFRPVGGTMSVRSLSPTSYSSALSHVNPGSAASSVSQSTTRNTGIESIAQRLGQSSTNLEASGAGPARSPNLSAEQEDHDLALALQLQEEEDDRHQQDIAARQREERLSREALSRDNPQANPQRRSGRRSGGQVIRPLVPPGAPTQSGPIRPTAEGAPPPSYAEAASGAPPTHHFRSSSLAHRAATLKEANGNGRRVVPNTSSPSRGSRMGSEALAFMNPRVPSSSSGQGQTPVNSGRQSMASRQSMTSGLSMGSTTTTGSEGVNGSSSKRGCVVM
ncbi:MAG: hypothetical protein M1816_002492 [Peltula sp. TS41687]|nr:MAG: hypothetical protein M1816_002492 [Peltula sp. TS41687]